MALGFLIEICCYAIAVGAVVVDEQGKPLSEFEARYNTAEYGGTSWAPGKDGVLPPIYGFDDVKVIDVFLRAMVTSEWFNDLRASKSPS